MVRNGLSNSYLKNTVEAMYKHHQNTPKPRFMTISRHPDEIVAVLGQQSPKHASVGTMLVFTQYRNTWLTSISSHCLAALPGN